MIDVPEKEIFRYLGYHGYEPDERILTMTREIVDQLNELCIPHSVWRTENYFAQNHQLHLGPIMTESTSLEYHLKGCIYVILYAATLGPVPDRMIQRYERLDLVRAAITQSASAAMIEAFIDTDQEKLKKRYQPQHLYMRSRFSPGYGDFPLSVQPEFLSVLEMQKRIGVTLTDGGLMMPSKSVTAVMGLAPEQIDTMPETCRYCIRTDCEYRNETEGDVR